MATPEAKAVIEDYITVHLDDLVKKIDVSRKIVGDVAANVQRFLPSDRTAELLGRIVAGNAGDLEQVNTNLRNQIQELDRKITEAATKLLEATKDADEKGQKATEKIKAAEESQKQVEEERKKLTEERRQVQKLIKENEEQLQNVAGIQQSLKECLVKLNEDRESARKREKFAESMETQIKDQTANQQQLMTNLESKYNETVVQLTKDKAALEKTLSELQKTCNRYEAMVNSNANSVQAMESQAVQMARMELEKKYESEKQKLQGEHEQELKRMSEAHKKEIERLEASHASRVSQIITEKAKIEKKQEETSQQCIDLRMKIIKDDTRVEDYKRELARKEEEYSDATARLWDEGARKVLESRFDAVTYDIGQIHAEIQGEVNKLMNKYEEVTNRSIAGSQDVKDQTYAFVRRADKRWVELANGLHNEVEDAKGIMKQGGIQAGELKLTQEQYAISLRAIEVLEAQAKHRDEVDKQLWDMTEQMAITDKRFDDLLEEKEDLEKEVSLSYDKVERFDEMELQLNALKSTSTDDTNKLLDEREGLLEKLQDTRNEVKHLEVKIVELEAVLDDTQKALDLCKQHRSETDMIDNAEINRLTQEKLELEKQLRESLVNRAVGAHDEALQRLDSRVSELEQQHSSRDDTFGGTVRRTSSRLAAREPTPTANLASRRGAVPTGLSIRSGSSPTPDIQVTPQTGPTTASSTVAGSSLARAQAPTAASKNRANAIASQPRAASRAGPTTPVTSTFPTGPSFGSIKGQKRSRESGTTPDKFGKLHKSTGAIAGGHAGLQPNISPLRTQAGTRDQPMDVDSPGNRGGRALQGIFSLPGAMEQVRLGTGLRPSTGPETRQGGTTEVAATVETSSGPGGSQGDQTQEQGDMPGGQTQEQGITQDEPIQGQGEGRNDQAQGAAESAEARIAKLRNGTILPPSNWPGPNIAVRTSTGSNADTSGISSADKLFGAVKKPSNWDATANQDFLRLIKEADNIGRLIEAFHRHPDCISARKRRHDQSIPDDQTDRCPSCVANNDICWGVQKLPDTQPPTGSASQKKNKARLNMVRNVDGHYWAAVYRPARGPGGNDDDATGGGTGGIPTA